MFPTQREQITNEQVVRIAQEMAQGNRKVYLKYFGNPQKVTDGVHFSSTSTMARITRSLPSLKRTRIFSVTRSSSCSVGGLDNPKLSSSPRRPYTSKHPSNLRKQLKPWNKPYRFKKFSLEDATGSSISRLPSLYLPLNA